jgi:serine/threonine protein kinase
MTESADNALPQGTLLKDRYTIVRLLGAGGMGAVYEARDSVLDKRVALKILHKEIAGDEQMNARFVQEARAASAFKHRNVVESLDFGAHEGAPFLVMEFLEGEAFSDVLEREHTLSPARAVSLLEPIARALARAHLAGIIHRDVKPDNVFLAKGDHDGECVPKLVDFGIAKRTTEAELRLTKTSVAMGTPFYMPPEQAMGARDVTQAADQYAFAAMMFEAVSGKFPHDGDSYNALIINKVTKEPLALTDACPGVDPAFAAVVMRALSKDPAQRFASMNELREALVVAMGGEVQVPTNTGQYPAANSAPDRDASTNKGLPAKVAREANEALAATAVSETTKTGLTPPPQPATRIPTSSVTGVERPSELAAAAPKSGSKGAVVSAALVGVALIGALGFALTRKEAPPAVRTANAGTTAAPTPPARRTLRVQVTPATATITADGRVLGVGTASLEVESGHEVELSLTADGHVSRSERLRIDSDQSVERVLQAQPAAAPTVVAVVDAGATEPARTTASTGNGNGNNGRTGRTGRSTGVHLGRTGLSLDMSLTPR